MCACHKKEHGVPFEPAIKNSIAIIKDTVLKMPQAAWAKVECHKKVIMTDTMQSMMKIMAQIVQSICILTT